MRPTFWLIALVLLASAHLSSCGFHLRGSGSSNLSAQKIYIEGIPASNSFVGTFNSALIAGGGGQLVATPVEATGVIHIYRASFQRLPITLSRTGRATGYDLIYRVVYEVKTPKGEILQPRKEFEVKRDYFNDQTLPLAQVAEEGQIREEIEKEAAQLLMHRMTTLLQHKVDDPVPVNSVPIIRQPN